MVGAVKLNRLAQVGVRHVESDGLVVDGLDGLGLGQVLVDGPRNRPQGGTETAGGRGESDGFKDFLLDGLQRGICNRSVQKRQAVTK